MPVLKQIACGVVNAEFSPQFEDGKVECYILLPEKLARFYIQVESKGFIAHGLAVFVRIDGLPSSNRSKRNIPLPKPGEDESIADRDFVIRQHEPLNHGTGCFYGLPYLFKPFSEQEKINVEINDYLDGPKLNETQGKLEVIVRRCHRYADPPNPLTAFGPPPDPSILTLNPQQGQWKFKYDDSTSQIRDPEQEKKVIPFGFDGAGDEPTNEQTKGPGQHQYLPTEQKQGENAKVNTGQSPVENTKKDSRVGMQGDGAINNTSQLKDSQAPKFNGDERLAQNEHERAGRAWDGNERTSKQQVVGDKLPKYTNIDVAVPEPLRWGDKTPEAAAETFQQFLDKPQFESPTSMDEKQAKESAVATLGPKRETLDKTVTHAIAFDRPMRYAHRQARPEYIDSMEQPYARFVFKYRGKVVLEQILGTRIDDTELRIKQECLEKTKEDVIADLVDATRRNERLEEEAQRLEHEAIKAQLSVLGVSPHSSKHGSVKDAFAEDRDAENEFLKADGEWQWPWNDNNNDKEKADDKKEKANWGGASGHKAEQNKEVGNAAAAKESSNTGWGQQKQASLQNSQQAKQLQQPFNYEAKKLSYPRNDAPLDISHRQPTRSATNNYWVKSGSPVSPHDKIQSPRSKVEPPQRKTGLSSERKEAGSRPLATTAKSPSSPKNRDIATSPRARLAKEVAKRAERKAKNQQSHETSAKSPWGRAKNENANPGQSYIDRVSRLEATYASESKKSDKKVVAESALERSIKGKDYTTRGAQQESKKSSERPGLESAFEWSGKEKESTAWRDHQESGNNKDSWGSVQQVGGGNNDFWTSAPESGNKDDTWGSQQGGAAQNEGWGNEPVKPVEDTWHSSQSGGDNTNNNEGWDTTQDAQGPSNQGWSAPGDAVRSSSSAGGGENTYSWSNDQNASDNNASTNPTNPTNLPAHLGPSTSSPHGAPQPAQEYTYSWSHAANEAGSTHDEGWTLPSNPIDASAPATSPITAILRSPRHGTEREARSLHAAPPQPQAQAQRSSPQTPRAGQRRYHASAQKHPRTPIPAEWRERVGEGRAGYGHGHGRQRSVSPETAKWRAAGTGREEGDDAFW